MTEPAPHEDLLRELAPQVLGALVRRHHDLAACEDALQDALLAASQQWTASTVPDHPRGWLLTVARRRLIDQLRSEEARRRREEQVLRIEPEDLRRAEAPPWRASQDDTLELLFLCAHPALSPASQMALTLRAVGGLSTAEIARAFLVPEATMTRRLTRARARIGEVLAAEGGLGGADRTARVPVVLGVLYLIFNEGYAASSGDELQRRDLATEAIRLTRLLHRLVSGEPEVAGLLALLLVTEARHGARTAADGSLVPLADQDRDRWDRSQIEEASALLLPALAQGRVGPYQLQAAIAAVHAEAPSVEATDWPQIVGLYRLLERVQRNPMVTLNRVVAEAQVHGVEAAQAVLATVADDPRVRDSHRLHAVRGHLAELAGDPATASGHYAQAARGALSLPERRHLQRRAQELGGEPG